jgi:hypothetical protein
MRVQFADRIASAEESSVANTVRERGTIIMPDVMFVARFR